MLFFMTDEEVIGGRNKELPYIHCGLFKIRSEMRRRLIKLRIHNIFEI